MGKKRNEVGNDYLSELLGELGGASDSKALWELSGMDIDEFYKQLREEVKAGKIIEAAEKERLELADAA